MRKIIAIFLCIMMLVCSAFAASPTSPVEAMLIYSNPVCEYVLADTLENWDELLDNTINNERFMAYLSKSFETGYAYRLDEILMTEVLPYNDYVVWHFAIEYARDTMIYMVLVDMNYQPYSVLVGDPLRDGTVLFDFSPVEGNTYYMFIYSSI